MRTSKTFKEGLIRINLKNKNLTWINIVKSNPVSSTFKKPNDIATYTQKTKWMAVPACTITFSIGKNLTEEKNIAVLCTRLNKWCTVHYDTVSNQSKKVRKTKRESNKLFVPYFSFIITAPSRITYHVHGRSKAMS